MTVAELKELINDMDDDAIISVVAYTGDGHERQQISCSNKYYDELILFLE